LWGVSSGQTFGLEHVLYTVARGTPAGVVPVSIVNLGTNTELLNINFNIIPSSASNRSINVGGGIGPRAVFVADGAHRRVVLDRPPPDPVRQATGILECTREEMWLN
jgi:hypothetical protein